VLRSGETIRQHALYVPALLLIVLGALTKSAQFPFQFWLPHAMAAPTPVSAYLHSATLVKAGVFLLARFWPVMAGTDAWFWIVGTAGIATLLLGAYIAIFQHDLKGLLAYSTISHLGLITLLLGLNSELGLVAAIFHALNHATFKASLFMAAGIIDHETGANAQHNPPSLRPAPADAVYRASCHGGRRGHGRGAAAQRLPLQGDVLCRSLVGADAASPDLRRHAVRRGDRERAQRCLFAALHPRRLLRPRSGRPTADFRTSRRPGCAAGRDPGAPPASCRHPRPGGPVGRAYSPPAVRSILGAATPQYSLACGTASPALVMSLRV